MLGKNCQLKVWEGKFGKEYTDRNSFNLSALDRLYKNNFGITRTELNNLFIGKFNRNFKILEVGSNMGNQLRLLQKNGFKNLYGIEINDYAVETSKSKCKNINIIQGSALSIPYKDNYFDLVFTSGVLIHVNPAHIKTVLREIHRCSKGYIWGYEYYSDSYVKGTVYRRHKNLFWKANFARLYLDLFDDLRLVKEKKLKYLNNENVDSMFLIKKEI